MLDRTRGNFHGEATAEGNAAPRRVLPPLEPLADASPVRARANWRWMLGTVLTGVVGMALAGGALYTTFEGRSGLAVIPNVAPQAGGFGLASDGTVARGARKGDRINSSANAGLSIKQIIHESSITKIGSKEFIQVKPYAHVTANLVLENSERSAALPPFDPLKLFAEAAEDGAEAPKQARIESSGEITVAMASFSFDGRFAQPGELGPLEAENHVRETLAIALPYAAPQSPSELRDPGHDIGLVEETGSIALLETGTEPLDADDGAAFVTEIEKAPALSNMSNFADKTVTVSRGDTLSSLLLANGTTPQEAHAIAKAMEQALAANKLMQGFDLRLRFANNTGEGHLKPVRISLFDGEAHLGTVGLAPTHTGLSYVALSEETALLADEETVRVSRHNPRAQLYESLYESGFNAGLPESIIARMIRIHAYDVDFKRQAQAGDSLEVFYMADDNEGNVSGDPEILYTALTVRSEVKKFYRFRSPDDGVVDFYDEEGKSAKKFLIRKPMNGGVFRSGFGMRRHPILGYRKMHTGADWAARSGTPIVAAGNGVIEKAEWTSGYGRYTVIRHANGYKTGYAHQSRFAKGIEPGVKVRQGQVIGYVGSTGLSTGPHLHYEVIVNGRPVDPMRIRVPRGRTLQGQMLTAFQREKARINWLMRQPPAATRVAAARAQAAR